MQACQEKYEICSDHSELLDVAAFILKMPIYGKHTPDAAIIYPTSSRLLLLRRPEPGF